MKLNYLPYLIFASFSFAASAHACNIDMLIGKQQTDANMKAIAVEHSSFHLTRSNFKNYCLFRGATAETKNKALFVHKKNWRSSYIQYILCS